MQKTSFLTLILLFAVALLAAYMATTSATTIQAFIRFFGLAGFMLLCVTLLIGPLMFLNPKEFGAFVEPRRAIGISAFFFVLMHFLLLLAYVFNWDIAIAFSLLPLQLGAIAFFIIIILTAISNDYAMRLLGPWWKRIQQFNYLIFVLSFAHFLMVSGFLMGNNVGNGELLMILLGIVVIALQVYVFVKRKTS